MNLPFFIASRVAFSGKRTFSSIIIRIAIAAIALSMTVMILSTALVAGFKNGISEKVFGFWGHIHIVHFDANNSFEAIPVNINQSFYPDLDTIEQIKYQKRQLTQGFEAPVGEIQTTKGGINHIQVFANKAGIIKTKDQLEGIVLKGIGKDYQWDFLKNNLIEGDILHLPDTSMSRDILISYRTSKRLKLGVDDKFTVHFVEGKTQLIAKFRVGGIYKTGLEEYDKKFALVDIRQIQKLNKWSPEEVSGFEVFIDDIDDLEAFGDYIYYQQLGPSLYSSTIREVYPNLFGWLDLQDVNIVVILWLVLIVAVINMTTALLILILERTNMIGILKALGNTNWGIRKIFIYQAAYITALGLFWGNTIGLSLGWIQQRFELITLPEESYYVSVAPIQFDWWTIIGLNAGAFIIILLVMIVPSYLVTTINPVKAIRFK